MLKQQKIMILGAGVYQEPLIRTALSMYLEVHVASLLGDYPGINIAPNFHPIDITDEKGILKLCQELEIDGILTTATDICIPTILFFTLLPRLSSVKTILGLTFSSPSL